MPDIFDFTEQELSSQEQLLFSAKEVVEFHCLDFNETRNQDLMLRCKVLTGKHTGREYTHFLQNKADNKFQREKLMKFACAFWTKEELLGKEYQKAKLINRKFSAVAQEPREYNGRTFQEFGGWRDLGTFTPADVPADVNPDRF